MEVLVAYAFGLVVAALAAWLLWPKKQWRRRQARLIRASEMRKTMARGFEGASEPAETRSSEGFRADEQAPRGRRSRSARAA